MPASERPTTSILATGSPLPVPRQDRRAGHREAQAGSGAPTTPSTPAERVLLLGAGPVGLELAGEIKAAFPDKHVMHRRPAPDVLPGPYIRRVRDELRRQLDEARRRARARQRRCAELPTRPGHRRPIAIATEAGDETDRRRLVPLLRRRLRPDYLRGSTRRARDAGRSRPTSTSTLLVGARTGCSRSATSSDADRNMAGFAGRQAATAAANILALITGEGDLTAWEPSPAVIIVPIGPDGGTGQLPGSDEPATAATVSERKGRDLFVDRYAEILGATPASRTAADERAIARSARQMSGRRHRGLTAGGSAG